MSTHNDIHKQSPHSDALYAPALSSAILLQHLYTIRLFIPSPSTWVSETLLYGFHVLFATKTNIFYYRLPHVPILDNRLYIHLKWAQSL